MYTPKFASEFKFSFSEFFINISLSKKNDRSLLEKRKLPPPEEGKGQSQHLIRGVSR